MRFYPVSLIDLGYFIAETVLSGAAVGAAPGIEYLMRIHLPLRILETLELAKHLERLQPEHSGQQRPRA